MNRTNDIIESLRTLGTKERSEKSKTMYPTSMEVIGVKNPELKLLMLDLYAIMRNESRENYISLCGELVASRIIECQMLTWLLLEKARLIETIKRTELEKLEGVLDNWVSVDTYGTIAYGTLWRIGTIKDDEVLELQKSENVWYRRLALVATVALNLKSRGGSGDSVRTLIVCQRAAMDHQDMVVKALSWALRSLIRWDKPAVSNFLIEHENTLHKRVIREVSHKLEFGTKN